MMAIIVGAAAAAIWLYLIVFRGRFWWPWPAPAAPAEGAYRRSVVAVIPARNEAEVIAPAITSLLRQRYPGPFRTVLVDDHSTDATVETAQDAARVCAGADRLTILSAPPVAEGWTGKLWALRHGIAAARRFRPDYLLLTDADIVHADDNLAQLVGRAESGSYDLVSLMVRLHCRSFWERLLIPAFVFFFFKLYPPRWVADPRRRTAAAAGGCVLIRRESLDRIGGVDQIRREIIDDCALARRVKCVGRVWLGASQATSSIREYGSWRPIWRMIARCAFAQLGFSPAALILTVAGMVLIYIGPPLLLLSASSATAAALARHEPGVHARAMGLWMSDPAGTVAAGDGAVLHGGDDRLGDPVLARPRRLLERPGSSAGQCAAALLLKAPPPRWKPSGRPSRAPAFELVDPPP